MRCVSDLEKLWVFRRGRTGEREVMCRMSWDASFFNTVIMRKGEEGRGRGTDRWGNFSSSWKEGVKGTDLYVL